ncbi:MULTISPECIES: discoidin domain-containing protein [Methylococcus]|uniref:Discoidin domain-containing protein n=1 Tax=Methylococcus capsulatus TaxID=414 RepID=A0ABZ2F7F2_METCP|nr:MULTISPECIES: discoidin domain-containing protein [Methylococcus]MDF9393472.1 discoidin domain-containing protein [Methylococcus capsulatus]
MIEVSRRPAWFWGLVLWWGLAGGGEIRVLDDFETLSGWTAEGSPGTRFELKQDSGFEGKGLRLDYEFAGGAGYVILRKRFELPLPENYAFSFRARGRGPANTLEFKLLDRGAQNVWWHRREAQGLPADWQLQPIRKSAIDFAWGPSGGAPLLALGGIEFALTASAGGRGTLWLDDLRFERRDAMVDYRGQPRVSASSFTGEDRAENALDGQARTVWRSAPRPARQWLEVDFGRLREYGGLVLEWDGDCAARSYAVELSDDGRRWRGVYRVAEGNGRRDYLPLPETESRYLRLDLRRNACSKGYGLRELTVEPPDFAASANRLFEHIARNEPRGVYPRYFQGEQMYWTLVGANGGHRKGLLGMDGALETERGGFTVEPFLYTDGRLLGWNEGQISQSLEQGDLPLPTVERDHGDLSLKVTGFAGKLGDAPLLLARYRVENRAATTRRLRLFLAIRPFQVNPPWQSLNMKGGVSPIHRIETSGRVLEVDGADALVAMSLPGGFGAAGFDQGDITDFLGQGRLPPRTVVSDSAGFASGAWVFDLALAPGAAREVFIAVPERKKDSSSAVETALKAEGETLGKRLWQQAVRDWREISAGPDFLLPESEQSLVQSLRANLAYILVNRDGAALRPGSRTYARSWIRDGALMSSALLMLGRGGEVKRFIDWYAGFQTPAGAIPCCVDSRGPDSVPENDSHGEFIYTLAEYYRYSRDLATVRTLWPHVVAAVAYIETLRQQRMTAAYRSGEGKAFYGLMPASISHEGYASQPVHAFWDDFWTLRGIRDAVMLAKALGDRSHAERWSHMLAEFRDHLHSALQATMLRKGIDYIPASADLGDIDPNAVAIMVSIAGEAGRLPQAALAKTFDDYLAHFRKRRDNDGDDGYTPYEVRIVEALVRLGRREDAWEVLRSLLRDQRPAAWRQWAEVVWRHPEAPRFIGDMPHSWIGAEFIRSLRSCFAYEDDADESLVLAAGIPAEWLYNKAQTEIGVRRLPTAHGPLDYRLRAESADTLKLHVGGRLTLPPGGIRIRLPVARPIQAAKVNGVAVAGFTGAELRIAAVPAEVEIRY